MGVFPRATAAIDTPACPPAGAAQYGAVRRSPVRHRLTQGAFRSRKRPISNWRRPRQPDCSSRNTMRSIASVKPGRSCLIASQTAEMSMPGESCTITLRNPANTEFDPRIHSGSAATNTRSRSAGWRPASVTTSTRRPSRSCASSSNPPSASALVPAANVTSRSTSRSSRASSRRIEPNSFTLVAPRRRATASHCFRWVSITGCTACSLVARKRRARRRFPR